MARPFRSIRYPGIPRSLPFGAATIPHRAFSSRLCDGSDRAEGFVCALSEVNSQAHDSPRTRSAKKFVAAIAVHARLAGINCATRLEIRRHNLARAQR